MATFSCGIRIETTKSIQEIEKWLKDNCTSDWHIEPAEIDVNNYGATVRRLNIFFGRREDKYRPTKPDETK